MILGFILILIVLIPYSIYLYIINKKLNKKIKELELEKKKILERKILKNQKENIVPIEKISNNINPSSKVNNIPSNIPTPTKESSFNIKDFINTTNHPRENNNKTVESYLEELSKKISEKEKQTPIELTEYEQNQEDNAIISYQELKSLKEKDEYIKKNNETEEFIENLKNLRDKLNS